MVTVTFGDFEWDEDKASSNIAKHGVSFEEAATIFLDPNFIVLEDSTAPDRYNALGFSRQAHLLFVVHIERGPRVRILSARHASRSERQTYERRNLDPS